jgi:hypothetical protein
MDKHHVKMLDDLRQAHADKLGISNVSRGDFIAMLVREHNKKVTK